MVAHASGHAVERVPQRPTRRRRARRRAWAVAVTVGVLAMTGWAGVAPLSRRDRRAGLRSEREDPRSEHVDERDPGGGRRHREPADFQPVRREPIRACSSSPGHTDRLPARSTSRSATTPRSPASELAERRQRQRHDRRLQPVLRARRLHRSRELLALDCEPDDQRGRQGRLPVRRVLGDLPGNVAATRPRQRSRHADGLLLESVLCERRVHRRLAVLRRRHRQRVTTAVPGPGQRYRLLDQRRVEPGLCRRRGSARPVLPEPALHDARHEPPIAREAVPLRRRERQVQRLRARRAVRLRGDHAGRTARRRAASISIDNFFIAKPSDSVQHQQRARPGKEPHLHAGHLQRRPDDQGEARRTPSCSASGWRPSRR